MWRWSDPAGKQGAAKLSKDDAIREAVATARRRGGLSSENLSIDQIRLLWRSLTRAGWGVARS